MAFYMKMGSKSQKAQISPGSGIKMSGGPLAKLECGTPTTPPCNTERKISEESYKGVQNGVSGTYNKVNYQTDFKTEGKGNPGGGSPGKDGDGGVKVTPSGGRITPKKKPSTGPKKPFKNPALPDQTYSEFELAPYGSPGKTADKYKPTPVPKPEYSNTKRSDLQFVPDLPPPIVPTPDPKPEPKPGPGGSVPGRGRKKITVKKPKISLPLGSGSSKGSGCPGGKKNCGAVNKK